MGQDFLDIQYIKKGQDFLDIQYIKKGQDFLDIQYIKRVKNSWQTAPIGAKHTIIERK